MSDRHRLEAEVQFLESPVRLDKYVSEHLGLFPRTQYERRAVEVLLHAKPVKPSYKLRGGEIITVGWNDLPDISMEPQDLPLDILYEDSTTLVVNKPRGMVVHPAQGNWTGTLVQGLLFYVKELEEEFHDTDLRPGIVHRLDKDTTGVLVTAKSASALEHLSSQFRDRTTHKTYYAVLKGVPREKQGRLETSLRRDPLHRQRFAVAPPGTGKIAVTDWKVLAAAGNYSLVVFLPQTGRTHQLRVHAQHLHCPILGDPIYSRPDPHRPNAPLMLHAARLEIILPDEVAPRSFQAPLPEDFRKVLRGLGLPDPPICVPG